MAQTFEASGRALFERADRAIAEAIATRDEIQAGLAAAVRRPIHRAGRDADPALPAPLGPSPQLEPWWSIARSVIAARDTLREAHPEAEAARQGVLPAIDGPAVLARV